MSLSHLATTSITSAYSSNNPLRQRTTNSSRIQPVHHHHHHHHVTKRVSTHHISCKQKKQSPDQKSDRNVIIDRRNMLLGLGGIYGATTCTMGNQAIGAPIEPPDLSKCHDAWDDASEKAVKCCPPYRTAKIIDFQPPSSKDPLRIRKPAHEYKSDDIAQFEEAIRRMKALPDNDPWSYKNQATIHCTYCNGAFDQKDSKVLLQIHGSWIFLPWHRYYIYFFEKILGKLMCDPTFAIPYWNWDTPKGMYIPEMFLNSQSPLFDDTRDKRHYTALLPYKYAYADPVPTTQSEIDQVTTSNLCRLNRIFKESLRRPSLFMGKKLSADEEIPQKWSGSNEILHNVMHRWVGPPGCPYENMGNFVTAARDPLFYGHHGNVDRMWDIYSDIRGHKREFKDPDWLESAFIFYDENRQVVKVKVKDCLRPDQLGYEYQPAELPWWDISRKKCETVRPDEKKSDGDHYLSHVPVSVFGSSPRTLSTETIQVLVSRPRTSRTTNFKEDKEDAVEVLVINGIKVAHGEGASFDVYIAKPIDGLVDPEDHGEYAGSFVHIPHFHPGKSNSHNKSGLELGITVLLEDIDAEDSEKLVVTLVPIDGEVTVEGVEVERFQVDDDDD